MSDLVREHRKHHDIEPLSIVLPICSENALALEAHSLYKPESRRVLLSDKRLNATDGERRHAPSGEHAKSCRCDPPATGARNDSASDLTRLVFAHHDHDFTEVRIAPELGNDEVEKVAVQAVPFKHLHDVGRVDRWERRHRERGDRIPAELGGSIEILLLERTEDERRATQWWIRKWKRSGDRLMVGPGPTRVGRTTKMRVDLRWVRFDPAGSVRLNCARIEGPVMMRRRPLRRAAVIGGVAAVSHHAGTQSGQAQAEAQQAAAPPPQAAAPPPQAAGAPDVGGADMVTQLENLKKLLDDGVLTQAEFDAQKQKLLSSS
jgi:Short C-terminal domain